MVDLKEMQSLKLGIGWTHLVVLDEPDVVLTFKGYAPVLPVRQKLNGLEYILYISAKSLGESLEELRVANDGKFTGLEIEIRKMSTDKFAKYEVRNAAIST
jgi:hypothetical protein